MDLDALAAEQRFSGVVRIDEDGRRVERAYGFADRAHGIANTPSTRFGMASGSKVFTAVVVLGLVGDGVLRLDTTARELLGSDLPLIADDVTVEHLLSHRSGIGDYLDEDVLGSVNDHVLTVPVHRLDSTEAFVEVLDGHPTKFPAGERFSYCNGGFVVLALLAERASGVPYADLVDERVCRPAGLAATGFERTDSLPGSVALGYLDVDPGSLRTNVLHLPVLATGDGGAYTTAADMAAFWHALDSGRLLEPELVEDMTRHRSEEYGLGIWLEPAGWRLVGSDAGASFLSWHTPGGATTTVISNATGGAWPVCRALRGDRPF